MLNGRFQYFKIGYSNIFYVIRFFYYVIVLFFLMRSGFIFFFFVFEKVYDCGRGYNILFLRLVIKEYLICSFCIVLWGSLFLEYSLYIMRKFKYYVEWFFWRRINVYISRFQLRFQLLVSNYQIRVLYFQMILIFSQ